MKIDPHEPIADGVLFDDLHRLSQAQINKEITAGRVYSTRFMAGAKTYGGTIIAGSYTRACDQAATRDLGEIVAPDPLIAAGRMMTTAQ